MCVGQIVPVRSGGVFMTGVKVRRVAEGSGRANQRRRTRKDLLQAAGRLMKQGLTPTLEQIAEEAMVSRATAYRYFPGSEALLVEATLDMEVPDAAALFDEETSTDPVTRLCKIDEALSDVINANETAIRVMLADSMQRRLREAEGGSDIPARQNRRAPLIEAALEPARARFSTAAYDRLTKALSVAIGTEATIVFKDVRPLPDAEARAVRQWIIRVLVEEALRASAAPDGARGNGL